MSSLPMAELVSCCFSLSSLLVKNRFVLSDLAGRLNSCQVFSHCISWSRGIENTVNIPPFRLQLSSQWSFKISCLQVTRKLLAVMRKT